MHNYFSKIAEVKRWENSIGIGQASDVTCFFIISSFKKIFPPKKNACNMQANREYENDFIKREIMQRRFRRVKRQAETITVAVSFPWIFSLAHRRRIR